MVKVIGPLASHHASGRMSAPRVYSSSLRNRKDREAPPAPPPPPPHDLEVTGTLTPDSAGYYDEAGTHNGQPYYERTDSAWFIYYEPLPPIPWHTWKITQTLGDDSSFVWRKLTIALTTAIGNYRPYHGATGTATVAEP